VANNNNICRIDPERTAAMTSKPMPRALVDGAELEFELTGTGEPVLLIHGALIAEAYAPLCAEPALNSRYQLVRYHRRGYAGSSPIKAPFSIGQQAADCRALLKYLGIQRAHVVGHSSGGVIALRLALDAPEVVHSLILLEPALLDVPSGALLAQAFEPVLEQYGAGNKERAADNFLRWAIGTDYRTWLDRLIPGAFEQLVDDADTFFGVELPSMQDWHFAREDAERITQPVLGVLGAESASIWPGWNEVQKRLREWLPQTEPFVLAGANHALEERDPRGVADAMAPFLARHPMAVAV
jgi:pimeloyl-ACP methyl ester carboxylesterase